MTADKRNAAVVIALILSMTLGARLLLWMEPSPPPQWQADPSLMAQRGGAVREVEITYADSGDGFEGLIRDLATTDDSICVIDALGGTEWEPRGPRVRLLVLGSNAPRLGEAQKRTLLAALGTFSHEAGDDSVRFRLSTSSDPQQTPGLSAQATDLRELLVRKQIIR